MGTPLSPEERDEYAPEGGFMRKMLDAGHAPWPSVEEVAYEDIALKLLEGEWVELPLGQKAGGRLAALEIGLNNKSGEMSWRIVHLDPPPPEDAVGAPDFPMEKPDPAFRPDEAF
jgi:hypothetical protein